MSEINLLFELAKKTALIEDNSFKSATLYSINFIQFKHQIKLTFFHDFIMAKMLQLPLCQEIIIQ